MSGCLIVIPTIARLPGRNADDRNAMRTYVFCGRVHYKSKIMAIGIGLLVLSLFFILELEAQMRETCAFVRTSFRAKIETSGGVSDLSPVRD